MKKIFIPEMDKDLIDICRIISNPSQYMIYVKMQDTFMGVIMYNSDEEAWYYCDSCNLLEPAYWNDNIGDVIDYLKNNYPGVEIWAE